MTDLFTPLTPEELARAPARGVDAPESICVMPVPEHAAEFVFSKRQPSKIWDYRDAQGRLLHRVARFEPTNGELRKSFRPITWRRLPDGTERWLLEGPDDPRPLYGLDRLAARPAAAVIVVEGEKAADAAQARFPEFVVVTSSGGSQAVAHADWTPLRGRRVTGWPDNDEPGREYIVRALTLAFEAGAESCRAVSVPQSFPEKWDLADPTPDGADLDKTLDSASMSLPLVRAYLEQLARLDEPEYQSRRRAAATAMDWSVGALDKQVKALRPPPAAPKPLAPLEGWQAALIRGEQGGILKRLGNAQLILANHGDLAGALGVSTLGQRECWIKPPPWRKTVPYEFLTDADITNATIWLERQGLAMARDAVAAVLNSVSTEMRVNPVENYLDGLTWDKQERLPKLFPYYFGVAESPYVESLGRMWPISAVARALNPGCKVDTVLVIEGPQGLMKSSALKTLFGRRWTLDSLSDIGKKDAAMQLSVCWCVELAELDHFARAEVNLIKRWLTIPVDNYRPPWARFTVDVPRPSIFVATHNPSVLGWQRDETGGRRYWPIEATKIDLEALRHDRDQIWAEAVARYRAEEKWWFDDDDEDDVARAAAAQAREEQDNRREEDVWQGIVADYVKDIPADLSGFASVTVGAILSKLGVPTERWDKKAQIRVGIIMAGMKEWKKVRERASSGDRPYVYRRLVRP